MAACALDILIVEDNFSFAIELQMLLKGLGYTNLTLINEGEQALESIKADPPDLILMDIHLKGQLLGIDVAEAIAHLKIPVLFISVAEDSLYERAQQLPSTAGYLIKPVHPITLQSAIELVLSGVEQERFSAARHLSRPGTIILKQDQTLNKVELDDIVYAKSEGNYLRIYIANADFYLIRSSLKHFLSLLPSSQFVRVHKQYLISLRRFKSVDFKEMAIAMEGANVPLGESYRRSLMAMLGY
jgi:DNA-binding LytR/AlgR family response regulator